MTPQDALIGTVMIGTGLCLLGALGCWIADDLLPRLFDRESETKWWDQ